MQNNDFNMTIAEKLSQVIHISGKALRRSVDDLKINEAMDRSGSGHLIKTNQDVLNALRFLINISNILMNMRTKPQNGSELLDRSAFQWMGIAKNTRDKILADQLGKISIEIKDIKSIWDKNYNLVDQENKMEPTS